MADEKKKSAVEQLQNAQVAREDENLSEDELNAVSGGKKDYCNHLGLDDLSSVVKSNGGAGRMNMELIC